MISIQKCLQTKKVCTQNKFTVSYISKNCHSIFKHILWHNLVIFLFISLLAIVESKSVEKRRVHDVLSKFRMRTTQVNKSSENDNIKIEIINGKS